MSAGLNLMPIEGMDDWEKRLARQDAFWDCAVLDRPVVFLQWPKSSPLQAQPVERDCASQRERWLDTERVVAEAVATAANTEYGGDALPFAWPNLGPEVFSAFFGLEMTFTENTSWAKPIIHDWSQVDHVRFSRENEYWKKLEEMTDALLEAGRGRFYVGYADIHSGGDAIAAFREPMDLNTDLLLTPEPIKKMLTHVLETYFEVYDYWHGKLRAAGQAVCTWPGIVSSRKWHVPQNDFSCMVSEEMFAEFFLEGIAEECRFLEASIYHLDGPGALRHLNALLAIPELNAIQWVIGAGNGRATDWLHVYRRCQEAGKGIQVFAKADEVATLIEHLRPEGMWLCVDVQSGEEAEAVLRKVSKWGAG